MINLKKLVSVGRKSILSLRLSKGRFVVYSIDRKRFVVPLTYLRSKIFRELFRLSEEVFGLPKDGPITLPCDGAFMEYVLSLKRSIALSKYNLQMVEEQLLMSLASSANRTSARPLFS
uniref:Uncharacterized protein n=2 Tax=Manihot esculenta TaxID=3983 RepID=A0A2C9U063_MANES